MGKLHGKVALITGAGSGIGRATSLLFASEGAKIVVVDYVATGGHETTEMIKAAGGESIFVKADVSKAADVEKMIEHTVDTYGRIDILYNNAGIAGPLVPIADTTEKDWDSVINTNLKGTFLGSKYAIPVMIRQGGGIIISTASTAGLVGAPGFSAYCASKGGIIQLTKAIALEYAKQNIRANCICPGIIDTPRGESSFPGDAAARAAAKKDFEQAFVEKVPLGRLGQPRDIAQTALYLACDDASYVTGAVLVVDGGVTVE